MGAVDVVDVVDVVELAEANRVAFEQSRATAVEGCMCLLAAFRYLGVPKTLLDVGCGPGHMVTCALAVGVGRCWGVDPNLCSVSGPSYLQQSSFEGQSNFEGLTGQHLYDFVLCLETAEHILPAKANSLCDLLERIMHDGGILLFSAATPSQGGSGHVNEQPNSYWIEKLVSRGLDHDLQATYDLRREWSQLAPDAWWYGRNLLVFRRPS